MVLDAVGAVEQFIRIFAAVYSLALILYVLTSWVQLPYSLRGVHRFLADVFLGTTATRVQHHISVPVLLLRAK